MSNARKEISKLELRCIELEKQVKEAIELLHSIEWAATIATESYTVSSCPSCCNWSPKNGKDDFWLGREERKGHKKDCKLGLFLEGKLDSTSILFDKSKLRQVAEALKRCAQITHHLDDGRTWTTKARYDKLIADALAILKELGVE